MSLQKQYKQSYFRQEAQFTDKLRLNLSNSNWFDSKQLEIPQIYWEFTTEKVLLMEWLDGKPILDADIAPDSIRK